MHIKELCHAGKILYEACEWDPGEAKAAVPSGSFYPRATPSHKKFLEDVCARVCLTQNVCRLKFTQYLTNARASCDTMLKAEWEVLGAEVAPPPQGWWVGGSPRKTTVTNCPISGYLTADALGNSAETVNG